MDSDSHRRLDLRLQPAKSSSYKSRFMPRTLVYPPAPMPCTFQGFLIIYMSQDVFRALLLGILINQEIT